MDITLTTQSAPLALSAVVDSDGIMSQKFLKEIIRVGKFQTSTVAFEVTIDTLHHWVEQFRRFQDNEISVYCPPEHVLLPENVELSEWTLNLGYVIDMFIDGESLMAKFEMIGEASIMAVQRNDCSLYSPPSWTDEKGNVYKQPITHIAITPTPIINGLSPFLPIAASHTNTQEVPTMDWKTMQEKLGVENMTDENAESIILSHISDVEGKLSTAQNELKEATETLALSGKEPEKMSGALLTLSHDNRKMKLDALETAGRLTPAARKILDTAFVDTLALSHGVDSFNLVVDCLTENNPVDLVEKTNAQTLELSHKTNTDSGLVADAKERAKNG